MYHSTTQDSIAQRQEEPIKNPVRNYTTITRAAVALRILTELTAEKQAILARCRSAPSHEHKALQARLQQIELDLAHAQEERRRARAGAPPAPPGHNPLAPPPRPSEVAHTIPYREPPLCQSTVEDIRTDYRQGKGLNKHALAEKYQVSYRQIQNILRHDDPRVHPTAKLNEAQVRDILRYYLDNAGRRGVITELADKFAVQKSTISDIVRRRSWRDIQLE